eukprot:scaffold1813_cov129-Isochrysis_galbana.AAC.2
MRSASLGGRARCGCRSVRGNVGVGTSPSAGPRALQPGGRRGGRLGFGICLVQRGRPSHPRMARQEPLTLLACRRAFTPYTRCVACPGRVVGVSPPSPPCVTGARVPAWPCRRRWRSPATARLRRAGVRSPPPPRPASGASAGQPAPVT